MIRAYLGVGSNIDAMRYLRAFAGRIYVDFPTALFSSLYQSRAVGFDGEDFINLAVAIETEKSYLELLLYAQTLEEEAGRVRQTRGCFDARTLDVDVLIYDDLVGEHEGHTLPDPDLSKYAHVLEPMTEIAPDLLHPVQGISLAQLWSGFESQSDELRRLGTVAELLLK